MVKTEAFPTIRMKIDRLLKITNEYQFNDLVKAVYCINLCINNRSVLESCLALNACLIEYEEKGSKRIGTYDEFKGFFGKIYDVMKPGIADDYTVEDFGEVQLRYNDKFYRVIIGTGPEDYHYHEVRKRIANVCYGNMIKPGIYRGQEANQIIRAMQKAIIEDFEGEVSKYSWSELHYSLLDYHSTLLHDIDINWKRYGSYSGLDEKKDKEVRDRIIDQREKAKHDDRNTLYLIETNLYLHCESETLATIDDINLLLAYANWLVVLNDVADMCHFADNEAYIEITDEYVVDTLADDQDAEALSGLHHRIYSYSGGLKRDHETDFKYLEKVKETFKEDMGFDLTDFLDILSYFSNSFSETIVKKIGNNVFRAPMKELLRDFLEQMNNVITEEDAATLFNYLVVSSQNLKTENGKINFYLPIGKRRTRDTRFELMPLVSINGDIIFSPITMDRLKKDWLNGIMDFILPYEVRMNKTKQLIVEWKKSYEKQIVYDIANSFKKNKFDIIKQNFELMKLNKSHPQWLGDYRCL